MDEKEIKQGASPLREPHDKVRDVFGESKIFEFDQMFEFEPSDGNLLVFRRSAMNDFLERWEKKASHKAREDGRNEAVAVGYLILLANHGPVTAENWRNKILEKGHIDLTLKQTGYKKELKSQDNSPVADGVLGQESANQAPDKMGFESPTGHGEGSSDERCHLSPPQTAQANTQAWKVKWYVEGAFRQDNKRGFDVIFRQEKPTVDEVDEDMDFSGLPDELPNLRAAIDSCDAACKNWRITSVTKKRGEKKR